MQRVGRARPHDGERAHAVAERQHAAVVVEQDHRALGERACDRTVLGWIELDRRAARRGRPVGVQQPELRLLPQDPPDRPVHELLRELARVHQLGERRIADAVGQLDVDARGQRLRARLRRRAGDAVQRLQERDAPVVGHHDAGEAPFVAEQVGEQPRVGGGRDAVDLAVGVHDRAGAVAHGALERRQQHVLELARADGRGPEVATRSRRRVAGEVLERRDDPRRLEAADVRGAERPDEVRVLAERLLDATPAVVAHDVEHGREALVHPDRAHALADPRRHRLHELDVERRRHRQRRREDRRAERGEAGQALLVRDRRDAEPRPPDELGLQLGELSACRRPVPPARSRTRGSGARGRGAWPHRTGGRARTRTAGERRCRRRRSRRSRRCSAAPPSPRSSSRRGARRHGRSAVGRRRPTGAGGVRRDWTWTSSRRTARRERRNSFGRGVYQIRLDT